MIFGIAQDYYTPSFLYTKLASIILETERVLVNNVLYGIIEMWDGWRCSISGLRSDWLFFLPIVLVQNSKILENDFFKSEGLAPVLKTV